MTTLGIFCARSTEVTLSTINLAPSLLFGTENELCQSGRADAYFGPNVIGAWKAALNGWVKAGLVDAVSSDAHNCTSRPTRMRQAYERLCTRVGQTTAQKLTGLDGTEYLV